MAYFDPFCPILTDLLFLDLILWWETKAIWKKLSILLDGKFPEFLFGKIRFSIGFHFLNLWAFAVSFPNGGSTPFIRRSYLKFTNSSHSPNVGVSGISKYEFIAKFKNEWQLKSLLHKFIKKKGIHWSLQILILGNCPQN